jgi:hypothetical protein
LADCRPALLKLRVEGFHIVDMEIHDDKPGRRGARRRISCMTRQAIVCCGVLRSPGNQTAFLWTTMASATDPADRCVVQVIAPVGLRATYSLQDGDIVEVELRPESG